MSSSRDRWDEIWAQFFRLPVRLTSERVPPTRLVRFGSQYASSNGTPRTPSARSKWPSLGVPLALAHIRTRTAPHPPPPPLPTKMAAIVASNFAVAAPSKVAARKNIARKSALPGACPRAREPPRRERRHLSRSRPGFVPAGINPGRGRGRARRDVPPTRADRSRVPPPEPSSSRSQALRRGEGCAQAAGGCQVRTNAASLAERARNPPPARSRPIRDPRAPLSPAAAREGEALSRVAPRPRVAPARSSRRAAIETRAGVGPRAARSIAIATLDASGEEEEPANRPARFHHLLRGPLSPLDPSLIPSRPPSPPALETAPSSRR